MREWTKKVGIAVVLAGIMILVPVGVGQEQQPQTPEQKDPDQKAPAKEEEQPQPEEKEDQGRPRTASSGTEDTESPARLSFGGSSFYDWRNHFGFSLGAYEVYLHDSYPGQDYRNSAMLTSFYPRVFANFGRRRSRLHLDAGFGYSFENSDLSNDQQEYSANASYTYRLSRKTSLQISDYFFSSPNYYGSLLQAIINPGPIYPPSYGSPTYRIGQRQMQNMLLGSVDRQLGRKFSIGFNASYNLYRYETSSVYNGDAVSIGISFGYQPAKWLSIRSSYSRYLNQVDPQFSDTTINDIQIGEFDFRLSRSWRAAFSGGIQVTEYYGQSYNTATARARLSHSSRNNTLSISYYRGFSTAIGLSSLYQSDSVQVEFGQRLARRISFLTGASYWNNAGVYYAGGYDYWLARTGLEFLLRPDLVARVQYAYQYQTGSLAADTGIVSANRNLVYFGIQYVWPGARH